MWSRPTSAMHLYMTKSNLEASLCSRGIISPLHLDLIKIIHLIPLELELQQVWKATFRGDYNFLTPLVQYNFTTGHAWDFWIIMEIKDLLQELSKEHTRFVYNLSAYLGPLIFKVELTDTTKVHLLEHMYKLQCLPSITDWNPRTMDYVRGSTFALELYKQMPTKNLLQMVEEWRKTSTKVEEAATASDGEKVNMPPTKKQATEQAIDEAELYRAARELHD